MREILFRGKPTASVMNEEDLQDCMFDIVDGFVYGNLIADEHEPTIVGKVVDSDWDYCSMEWWCPVVKETVGQFTGLLDKHGRKIFEGDIVVTCPSPLSISDGGDISKRLVVDSWVFTDMCHSAMCKKSSKREKFYKIVGNIHDNPDLVEAR